MTTLLFRINMFVVLPVCAMGAYYYWNFSAPATSREMTCLSTVIPQVVLHHEQEHIVMLLQSLADETGEAAPENPEFPKPSPIFSQRVDKELLDIADIFKMKNDSAFLEQANVASRVAQVLQYFRADAPKYIDGCLSHLEIAEKDCGTIENPTSDEKQCLEKHSDRINQFVRSFVQ